MAKIIKGKNPRKPYTVRYRFEGRQREKSFETWRQAHDFQVKFEHDIREQIFVDPKLGNEKFRDASAHWLERLPVSERTKSIYASVLANHVNPALGDRTLRQVANDRDAVRDLLLVTMPAAGIGPSWVQTARNVVSGVIRDAIKSGKLASSRVVGIKIPPISPKAEFVFPSHAELTKLADSLPEPYGVTIWLMRGCGLRIGEALAVRADAFSNGTLRVSDQLLTSGEYGPLKHRKPGDFRDVPVPSYVAAKVADIPATGERLLPLVNRRRYQRWFITARKNTGIDESFIPHTCRHLFASVALSNGVPITDVSKWLGHQNINTTYAIYGHLVPSAWDRARQVLDAEYEAWSATS